MSHAPRDNDRILFGGALVLTGVFLIVSMNTLAKLLGTSHHPVEMTFYRNVMVFAGVCLYLTLSRKWELVRTKRIKSHMFRALVGTTGIICGFWAVTLLPLADATTLIYTAPLFATVLSIPLLGERVGLYRWAAVFIGFIGVIFIAHPTEQNIVLTGTVLALMAAFFNASVQIFLRDLGRTEHPLTTVFYFMGFGILFTAVPLPFVWTHLPSHNEFFLLALLGLTGGLQQVIKTSGYAITPTSISAPLNYTGLIWAALFGWVFWGTLPTWQVITGAAIIVGSTSFILWREQRLKKREQSESF